MRIASAVPFIRELVARGEKRGLVLDFDLSLADTKMANNMNLLLLSQRENRPVDMALIERISCNCSGTEIIKVLHPQARESKDELDRLVAMLVEIAVTTIPLIKPTPLMELLPELHQKGIRLGVATNRDSHVGKILKVMDIDKYFLAVMNVSVAPQKPDPAMLYMAMEKMGVTQKETLFVGDLAEDEETGRNAGVDTLIVRI